MKYENGEKRMEGKKNKKKNVMKREKSGDEGQERVGKEKQRKKAKETRWMKQPTYQHRLPLHHHCEHSCGFPNH